MIRAVPAILIGRAGPEPVVVVAIARTGVVYVTALGEIGACEDAHRIRIVASVAFAAELTEAQAEIERLARPKERAPRHAPHTDGRTIVARRRREPR